MSTSRLSCPASGLVASILAVLVLVASTATGQEKKAKDDLGLDKIPKAVMDALKAKFPQAKIHQWTKAKEGDDIVYDIEFTQQGRKCEADIKENGTYINFEQAIEAKALPAAVRSAIDKKYPKASFKEIMEITEVKGKAEMLEGYEVVLATADRKTVEMTLAPDGKIVEETEIKAEKK